jgi:hypothetical protein
MQLNWLVCGRVVDPRPRLRDDGAVVDGGRGRREVAKVGRGAAGGGARQLEAGALLSQADGAFVVVAAAREIDMDNLLITAAIKSSGEGLMLIGSSLNGPNCKYKSFFRRCLDQIL